MTMMAWRTRSLRFWLTFGLALAVVPLAISAVLGHVLVKRGVIAAFADVTDRHRYQLNPAFRLRTALIEATEPVDEFIDDGDPTKPAAYRLQRERIEAAFAELHGQLQRDTEAVALLERARDEWTLADRVATEAIAVRRPGGDPHGAELMRRFHGLLNAAADKASAVTTTLEANLVADHDTALLAYERSDWIAGVAGAVSIIAMFGAVVVIGRVVSSSVDRLVAGAARFAEGDRDHRIDVQVPPELHSVAQEFNRMIVRIHESEAALSDLARRDGLTKLPNRRAFEDGIEEMLARVDRLGEAGAVLMLDVDHFKRVNDTYGHGVGDDVLRVVARTMVADVRLVDHVYRIGGEEFAVVLTGADASAAGTIAERLRTAIAEARIPVKNGEIGVTISAGIATARRGVRATALVEAADGALYRAKKDGRNRVVTESDA